MAYAFVSPELAFELRQQTSLGFTNTRVAKFELPIFDNTAGYRSWKQALRAHLESDDILGEVMAFVANLNAYVWAQPPRMVAGVVRPAGREF